MSDSLLLEIEDGIAWLTFNRPDRLNALDLAMWQRIPGFVRDAEARQDVRVLVLRGAGDRAFSAGADITEFQELRSTPEGARRYDEATDAAEEALAQASKPTVAMVRGLCIGGGCGLAVACDLRVVDEQAAFAITPAKIGLVYGFGSTKRVADLVGPSRAKLLLFSGEQVDARRALAIGLVDEVVPGGDLERRVAQLAATIGARAQMSIRAAKRMIELLREGQATETDETRRLRLDSYASDDYREGVQAFLDKRPPRFTIP